jgi:hypothetical protein
MTFKNVCFFYCILLLTSACNNNESKFINTNTKKADSTIITKTLSRKELQLSQPVQDTLFNKNAELLKVEHHYKELKKYLFEAQYNNAYLIIINMHIPSYKKRLFVYDIKDQKIISSAMVSHGQGSVGKNGLLHFSNTPNSKQTSLGKYKVGVSYYGTYGFAYRLHGLDNSNNKALERNIVLHSYVDVPDDETNNEHIVLSSGCPMVSINYMQKLKKFIAADKKPMLLSIIY